MSGITDLLSSLSGQSEPFLGAFGVSVAWTNPDGTTATIQAIVDGPITGEFTDEHDEVRRTRQVMIETTASAIASDPVRGYATIDGVVYVCAEVQAQDNDWCALRCVERRLMEAGGRIQD